MVKPSSSKSEYFSYIYLFLGLIIIVSIIILFGKIHSLNSQTSRIDGSVYNNINDLNALKNSFNDLNDNFNILTTSLEELNLKEVLKELSMPRGIFYAGADADKPLTPSDVFNIVGSGKIGFIQQHLDIAGTFGYSNVLNMVPNSGYISQILLSTIYNTNATKNVYIRYSTGTVADISATPPKNNTWTAWNSTKS
jgi:hypothetical protein